MYCYHKKKNKKKNNNNNNHHREHNTTQTHVSAVWEHLLKNAERQFSERKIGKRRHVFCHVTTLRAQNDVRDVAL